MSAGVTSALIIGYSGANRYFGNAGTQPLLQTSGSTITQIQAGATFYNLNFDGAAQTASRHTSAQIVTIYCTIQNFNTVDGNLTGLRVATLITGCTVSYGGIAGSVFSYCEAYANTAAPFTGSCFKCLSYSNTGAATDGFLLGAAFMAIECHAINNGRSGFRGAGSNTFFANCHAQSNGISSGTGYGYQAAAAGQLRAMNCTGVLNQTGLIDTSVAIFQYNVAPATADVYVNVAGNNYSLNNLAGAGAALRAAGRMMAVRTYPRGLTSSFFDIGGVQHEDITAVIAQMVNIFQGE